MKIQMSKRDRKSWLLLSGMAIVSLPALSIFAWMILNLKNSSDLSRLGWIFAISGMVFLAISTMLNFDSTHGNHTKKFLSTHAELGIISMGLALISPIPLISYYFYLLVLFSAVFFFIEIFIRKDEPELKTGII